MEDYLDRADDAVNYDKYIYVKVIKSAAETAKHWKGNPTNRRFNKDVIDTLVDAIMYEPTNRQVVNPYQADSTTTPLSNWQYVGRTEPTQLSSYLTDFVSKST